jgi:hypothetical protein
MSVKDFIISVVIVLSVTVLAIGIIVLLTI